MVLVKNLDLFSGERTEGQNEPARRTTAVESHHHRLNSDSTKPFLKWAGSKFRILGTLLPHLPGSKRLIEPFVGSGAVFLNCAYAENTLADSNSDLITLYQHVKTQSEEFIEYGSRLFTPETNTENCFYAFRSEYNSTRDAFRKSALFVYLNRHCFNGLCRYNSKGEFNVPFGRYAAPKFPEEEVRRFAVRSQNAEFLVSDFRRTIDRAERGDVIYCDPPYASLSPTSNFSDYTKAGFSDKDQLELAGAAREAANRGCTVVISNHDTAFTREIYAGAILHSFDVQRFISSKANNRGKAAELIAVYG